MAPDQVRGPVTQVGPRTYVVIQHLLDDPSMSRDQIARKMGVSVETVKTMLRRLYAKVGVQSRAELLLKLSREEIRVVSGR